MPMISLSLDTRDISLLILAGGLAIGLCVTVVSITVCNIYDCYRDRRDERHRQNMG